MHRIAIVGDADSVTGFKAAGYSPVVSRNATETGEIIRRLANEKFAIIFVTENVLDGAETVMDEYRGRMVPAIIPIPGNRGSTGIGMRMLKKAVERAIGADILKQD